MPTPPHPPNPDPRGSPSPELLGPIRDLLVRAGEAALERFRRVEARWKPDGSEVTDADQAAEAVLVAGLARAFPEISVASEEGTAHAGRPGEGTWYVDPIDGTSAFLDGLAHWGPTVALVRNGALVAGALWLPRIQEFWYAERGRGAWRDGVRLAPPEPGPPERHQSLYLPSRYHRRMPLDWPGKVRALGSSAAHLALVAGGGGVATVIPRWQMWDVGCGILLVEESHRRVATLSGEPFDPVARPGEAFFAGTPGALEYLTRRLAPR